MKAIQPKLQRTRKNLDEKDPGSVLQKPSSTLLKHSSSFHEAAMLRIIQGSSKLDFRLGAILRGLSLLEGRGLRFSWYPRGRSGSQAPCPYTGHHVAEVVHVIHVTSGSEVG